MQIVLIRSVSYHLILNPCQEYDYLTQFIRNKILATFEENRVRLEYYRPVLRKVCHSCATR